MAQSAVRSGNIATFMSHVYTMLAVGLGITAGTSFLVSSSPYLLDLVSTPGILVTLCIIELAVVFGTLWKMRSLSLTSATGALLLYSVLNGATLTPLLMMYTGESVFMAFTITSSTVITMSLFGYFTKKNLSGMNTFFLGVLIGLLALIVFNMFIVSSQMSLLISGIAVFVFTGLIAYDTQAIKSSYRPGMEYTEEGFKTALMGALSIYLDFINLFIHLLRLVGDSND